MAERLSSQQWVDAWLRKAEHDIETADRALRAGTPITDTAAYHCHQAAEKALKAYLAWRGEPVAKIHDLMALLTRCNSVEPRFAEWADKLADLSAFGTVLRYPSLDADPSLNDATDALKVARQINGFVISLTRASSV